MKLALFTTLFSTALNIFLFCALYQQTLKTTNYSIAYDNSISYIESMARTHGYKRDPAFICKEK